MKKYILITTIILTSLLTNCSIKENDDVILKGKIEGIKNQTLKLYSADYLNEIQINVNDNNSIEDTLKLNSGNYYLSMPNGHRITVFLEPGKTVEFKTNYSSLTDSLIFYGDLLNENNYLKENSILDNKLEILEYYGSTVKLNEKEFLYQSDSINNLRKSLLENHESKLDKKFVQIEKNSIKYKHLYKLSSFEFFKSYFTDEKDFKVSIEYPKFYDDVNLQDETLIKSRVYFEFVSSYIGHKVRELNTGKDSTDYTTKYFDYIQNDNINQSLKELLAYKYGKRQLKYSDKLDLTYKKINSFLVNETYIKSIETEYESLKKIEKGQASPNFEFADINDKIISLNQLRGKVVYIDIWATWCRPCIVELTHMEKIIKEFENEDIEFVSICYKDKYENWTKMLEEKKLPGIQLFAEDPKSNFFQDYKVQGIPRYILIDKQGNIINANAGRPSMPHTSKIIKDLL